MELHGDTRFSNNILWVCAAFSLPLALWVTGFEKFQLHEFIGMVLGGWILLIFTTMVILAPLSWYQQARIQYALPRSLAAALILGSMFFAELALWVFQTALSIPVVHIAWGLFVGLAAPFALFAWYVERKRWKMLKKL